MNWVFPNNRFPELCSGKYFILTKAYFSDCIVSSVLIEACRRTFLHALPSHSKTYTQFLLTAYHFLTLTQPWKCGWLLSTYFQINGHLPETQKQRCPCCHAWVPLLFDLLFSFCMEISWLLNQSRGLDSSVRLKVQLAFCCLGRNSKSHLLELCFLQRLPQ